VKSVLPQQFTPDQANNLRLELDSKIERRVTYHVFYWAIGLAVLLISGAFAYINKVNDKLEGINSRLVIIETKAAIKNNIIKS
jgi:hypothetical protein